MIKIKKKVEIKYKTISIKIPEETHSTLRKIHEYSGEPIAKLAADAVVDMVAYASSNSKDLADFLAAFNIRATAAR